MQDGGRAGIVPRRLCRADEIPEGAGRGFRFGTGTERQAILVVRKRGTLFAYLNACPHVGTPLDWQPDRFLDITGTYLLCGTHGALFRIEDGFCIEGPCAGRSLAPAQIRIEAGEVLLIQAG